MKKVTRRAFIKTSVLCGAAGLLSHTGQASLLPSAKPTPAEVEGPFYPVNAQKDTDFDLTHVQGQQGSALGRVITINGMVMDTNAQPIEDATVELWQANAAGRYAHPYDTNPAPIDPNFQGWAIVPSGKQGEFQFQTVFPGVYPVSSDWLRPPHIHFKISKKGYETLVTQMYFPGHALNEVDALLARKSPEQRQLMVAKEIGATKGVYRYHIVLLKQ